MRAFGKDCGDRRILRLSQLEAQPNLALLRQGPGRCHELSGNRLGELAIDLKHPLRLIIRPVEPIPRLPDGGLDWQWVTSVEIVEVIDYHV
jgi:hypothetical protein